MNISYSWLKRYLDFNMNAEDVADALTSIGLETEGVEKVESIKGGLAGLVVGKVLTCVEHPNSDHLHITTVDLGNGEGPTQIVCGAPNIAAGQTVIVATLGTTLYFGEEKVVMKKSKIRGVESFGMICAEDEIGVGHSHDGIIELDSQYAAGTPAKEIFPIFEDSVISVDITPNRIDAASHYGVARDFAAYLKQNGEEVTLRKPSTAGFAIDRKDGAISVEVQNGDVVPRYSGLTIRNVKVQESPEWLKNLLTSIGQRPINNIVDITNFILFSLCQPLHCFDLAKVKGNKVIVRNANNGDKFVTLDGVERTLNEADIMICNEQEPMCIGGVFGGLDSGVTETTTDIFLESACFNATAIRKTARRQGLNTDASFRFERGVDPNGTVYALKVAALLVKELAGGEICGDIVDIYPNPVEPCKVKIDYTYINELIGKELSKETVRGILASLEMKIVSEIGDTMIVSVPTYRVDVQRPCDIVEDILRIYGYNNVEFGKSLRSSLSQKGATDIKNDMQDLISEQLTAQGFNEILNNSLTAQAYYEELETFPAANCVKLLNPLSNDLNVMRQTLLFGGLESIAHNVNRKSESLCMYEFGNAYTYNAEADNSEKILARYSESSLLGLWMTGNKIEGNWADANRKYSVFDLKAVVENIFARLGISEGELQTKQFANDIYSVALQFSNRGGKQVATMGVLKKSILKMVDIDRDVFFAEIDWNVVMKLIAKKKVTFTDLPKSQAVKRDLALLIKSEVTFADVKRVITATERRLLKDVTLFDVYEGKNLPAGTKSYAVSLTLQDNENTLQDKVIEKTMTKIIDQLKKQLDAELR